MCLDQSGNKFANNGSVETLIEAMVMMGEQKQSPCGNSRIHLQMFMESSDGAQATVRTISTRFQSIVDTDISVESKNHGRKHNS